MGIYTRQSRDPRGKPEGDKGKKMILPTVIIVLLMGISRNYLMAHFPSDVLGGIIVGLIGGIAGTLIAAKLPAKWYELNFFKKGGDAECSDSAS